MNIHSRSEVEKLSKTKQEDVLEAAMQLFAERGYDGTTVPMIAEKAKVGAGTIYRYFDSKESLVNSLFTKCVLQLSELIRSNFPIHASVREQFTHIYSKLFEFALYNVEGFLFINSHCDGYFLDEHSTKIFNDFIGFIINIIECGIEQGVLRPLPPIALIALVYNPIEGLIKVMEKGELTYTAELLKGLEESSWDAIRIN